MTDRTREALAELCKHFPTDEDMDRAGWNPEEIESACKAYDAARAALAAAPQAAEPVARLLYWDGPSRYVGLHGGVCARTYSELPKIDGGFNGYWREGPPLYAAPQPTQQPTEQDERAAFEAWCRTIPGGYELRLERPSQELQDCADDEYLRRDTAIARRAWLACRSSLRGGK